MIVEMSWAIEFLTHRFSLLYRSLSNSHILVVVSGSEFPTHLQKIHEQ
jgi:hypothetical protein